MEREQLQIYLDQRLSQRKMAERADTSQTNIRYWLKHHNLKQDYNQKGADHKCSGCGETNPEKFFGWKRSYCGKCHNDYAVERTRKQKLKIIEVMGGGCCLCGFNQYPCSLQVHHLNPKIKDPQFSTFTSWTWERIAEELRHCALLCANCHAAVHAGFVSVADEVLASV